jgi:hypothetical protein
MSIIQIPMPPDPCTPQSCGGCDQSCGKAGGIDNLPSWTKALAFVIAGYLLGKGKR